MASLSDNVVIQFSNRIVDQGLHILDGIFLARHCVSLEEVQPC
jgi:hypothetical protein